MTWLTGSEPYNPDGNRGELNNQRSPGVPPLNQQEERSDQRKQDKIE